MSDEPKKRSRAWFWWAALLVVPLYVLSIVPVTVVAAWMAHFGLVNEKNAGAFLEKAYAPIVWVTEHSEAVETAFNQAGRKLQPLFPER